jgi:hypothetical protein
MNNISKTLRYAHNQNIEYCSSDMLIIKILKNVEHVQYAYITLLIVAQSFVLCIFNILIMSISDEQYFKNSSYTLS